MISVLVEMCKEDVQNSQAKAKAAQGRQPSCNSVSVAVAAENMQLREGNSRR